MFNRAVFRSLGVLGKPLGGNLNFIRLNSESAHPEYIKTTLVRLSPDEGYSLQITSVDEYGFKINNNIRVLGPMAIFPKTIYRWNVAEASDIDEKSLLLFKLLEPRIDILVIGTGDKGTKIDPNVPKWLIKNKINNFEILPTEKAVNAFNFLVGDNRFVGALLLPSKIQSDQDPSVKKVFDRAQLYRELEREDTTRPIGDAAKPLINKETFTNKLV